MPLNTNNIAHTSGFRNNCAFHCFAHNLFTLNEKTINEAAVAHPEAFARLYSEFQNYYGIQESVNLDFILNFNKTITHPYEREVIWGPVLRNILVNLYEQPIKELLDYEIPLEEFNSNIIKKTNTFIENDSINLLANAFGATTTATIHDNNSNFLAGNPQPSLPWTNQWAIDLHNFNNAHWEFSYPDKAHNEQHNQQRDIVSPASSKMERATNAVGVKEQNIAIKNIVHKLIQSIKNIFTQELANDLKKANKNSTQSGVELLWQAAGNTNHVEKDEEKALDAIIKQQMEIEQDIQAKRPKP